MQSIQKKLIRWLISGGAALCLLAGLLLPTPVVAAPDATITIAAPATVQPAEAFTVPLNISHVDALDVTQFDITFDSGVLTFESASAGEIDGTTIPVDGYAEQSSGVWRVVQNVSGIIGATGEGYLCEVHFTAGDSGSTEVNLDNVLLADSDESEIPVTWSPVTIEIGGPTIAFSPGSLSFGATEGGDNPADQTLEIWNSGTGTLDWSVSEEAAWLSLSPTSGSSTGEHDSVTVSVDISGMSAGDYDATITISDPEATNSPQTVPVSLNISTPSTEPTIAFSPGSLSFGATEGGDNPADQTLEIWNSGTGTLDWSVSEEAAWLSLSPTSGSSTGEHDSVTVSADISGMSAGDYDATITISDPEAANSPQTVPVSLNISSAVTYYSLTVTCSPTVGGSVTLAPAQPAEGYGANTSVQLTAAPATGYDFGSWSGDLSGSTNPATITMSSNKAVTANFVEFSAPANVDVTAADPGVGSIDVTAKSLDEVDLTNRPERLLTQEAYVVDPTGSGSFTLRFTGLANTSNIRVYKVGDTTWTELPVTVIDATTVEVTMEVEDPTIVFGRLRTGAGGGGTGYLPDNLKILGPWIGFGLATILLVVIIYLIRRRKV